MDNFSWRNHYVPRIALGTVQLGLPYGIANKSGQPDFELACKIVKVAWENGIRFFDTAQAYGQSEKVLGQTFAALDIADQAQVVTKLGLDLESKSAAEIAGSIEISRKLLGVPKFFGVMLHRGSWLRNWRKRYKPAFNILREKGITSYAGVSVYTEAEIKLAFELPEIDLIQVPFNVFDQRGWWLGWFEKAHALGKLIIVRSIYLQGLLLLPADKLSAKMEFAREPLERFHSLCQHYRLKPANMALGYVANKSPDTILLFGAEVPAQIVENISLYKNLSCPKSAIDEIDVCFADLDTKLINPSQWTI